jgi:hypothetical protein
MVRCTRLGWSERYTLGLFPYAKKVLEKPNSKNFKGK